jgi:hypothetical protein
MLVPDGITPLIAHRSWEVDGDHLTSLNGVLWEPQERMEASCDNVQHVRRTARLMRLNELRLVPKREIQNLTSSHLTSYTTGLTASSTTMQTSFAPPSELYLTPSMVPDHANAAVRTIPPDGYAWVYHLEPAGPAPFEECSCGIYALKPGVRNSYGGAVRGEVWLWGKVIVGEHGYRAQYAYPKLLVVDPPSLAKKLAAYDVPITGLNEKKDPFPPTPSWDEAQAKTWRRILERLGGPDSFVEP